MNKAAVLVSRGTFNNLVQVATLVRALTVTEAAVRVFFRDTAVVAMTKEGISRVEFSEEARALAETALSNLQAADFTTLEQFLRDSKEHGDDVRFYACTSSMYIYGVTEADLVELIDEPLTLTAFLMDEVDEGSVVMSF